jgi:peptidyl-prolyl cis-trans isomerase B (cyclophilin B)
MPGKIWSKKGKCNMKRRGLKFLALSISAALLVGTLAACGSKKDSASKSSGDNSFVITLYPDVAPITCENFEKLVKDGFYDGLKFHRVVEDFMAQGGDPKGDGTGGSTDTIKGEFSQNGVENTLSHTRGVVSMARSNDPDSASSQFFICYGDESFLDGQYAAFGKVTEGMDVVDSFVKVERSMGSDGAVSSPNTDIIMENVKMIDDDSDGNPRVEITMNDFLK